MTVYKSKDHGPAPLFGYFGKMKGQILIFGAKVAASRVNEKIRQYANEFVLCSECGKPDTKIEKEGKISYLRCTLLLILHLRQ